ncbi:MAG: AAA family ATPase [Candidatus Omnitrophota bacterium]|nr:AAA family ATPase [Candidatus Omnitrophota bacterium]
MIRRNLEKTLADSKKSILLLGPRQTGKSTMIHALKPDLEINFADQDVYLTFAKNPKELEERLAADTNAKSVFIDEIQRLPSVLNTIQAMLDKNPKKIKFYLTGSSARKLRRGHANLLPGRVHLHTLSPLVASELDYRIKNAEALSTGLLPGIWTEKENKEKYLTLRSYASTYLKEEIKAESLTRNLEGFSRFLFVAAAEAGKFLDLSRLSRESAVPRQSIVRYFEILEDTLVVNRCEAFSKSERRRLIQSPKFFFFDTGVLNGLLENFIVSSDRIGYFFEHLIFNQLVGSALSKDKSFRIASYRTEHGAEVDFLFEFGGEMFAIEAKASKNISGLDTRGFKSFSEYYGKRHEAVVLYTGDVEKRIEGIHVLPWQIFFKKIGL